MAHVHPIYHGGKNYAEQITDEFLTCRLCREPGFRQPKILLCGHTFCQHCIEGALRYQQKGALGPGEFFCFLCGAKSKLPYSGPAGLPDNVNVNTQIDKLLMRHNADRAAKTVELSRYNIRNYVIDPEARFASLPLPGEKRNHDLD